MRQTTKDSVALARMKSINQTRSRESMGRPTVFADKTKYNRKSKNFRRELRKQMAEY